MERMTSLGIVFTVGLALSAPVTAEVIVNGYNGQTFASAFVAHNEGNLPNSGGQIFDGEDISDEQANTTQTFSAGSNASAQASLLNLSGQEISAQVSAGHSVEVQRNGEQVSFLGAATSNIQGIRQGTFFEANNSLLAFTNMNLSFSLTTPYEVILDFNWTLVGGNPAQYNRQFFNLSSSNTLSTSIRYEGPIPGSYAYLGLLSPGDYGLNYIAQSDNLSEAFLPPVAASNRGGFSIQLTPVVQAVPEPTGIALFALGLFGLLKRRASAR